MSDMKHSFLVLCAAALAATACTNDELGNGTLPGGKYPLELTAANLHEAVATPAVTGTRSTVDGNWEDALSVAVQVGGENGPVKEYKVASTSGNGAKLTCSTLTEADTQFWWTSSNESKKVRAWYPYSETVPVDWSVSLTQTEETLKKEDFMMTDGQVTVSLNNPQIAFSHLLAKVEINLIQSEYLRNASKVSVSLPGMYETGTLRDLSSSRPVIVRNNEEKADKEIIPYRLPSANDGCYASYQALIIPDEEQKTRKINVIVDDVIYTLSNMATYNPRFRYTYNITVQEEGLEIASIEQSIDWNATNPGSGGITLKDHYDQATKTYYVYTADGLDAWAEKAKTDLTISCILMDDIDYNDKEWTAIGDPGNQYAGTFAGGGHTIRNIKINGNAQNNGLFGYIAGGGIVKNLTVKNASMTTSGTKYGIIAAWNDGTIENCVVSSCDITGSSDYVGCISYQNFGRISCCRVDDANVSCGSFGGIVWLNNGRIEASSFQGHIDADGGALVETNSIIGGTIIACWTDATHEKGKTVAGIVRYLDGGSVTACYYGGDMDAGILEGNGDATKVDGSTCPWGLAAGLMNSELGLDFGWHWQTDNEYTPPTLVPNN